MNTSRRHIPRLLHWGLVFILLLATACSGIVTQTPTSTPHRAEPTLTSAGLQLTHPQTPGPGPESLPNPARYIILFIGDGMGANHRQAAAWNHGALAMDTLPVQGWLRTTSLTSVTTDSAAAATAMAAGKRTGNLMVGVNLSGQPLDTILELARRQGLSAGLVTTGMISDATPAAFATHHISRAAYNEISLQLAESGIEVLLGGGEVHFLPPDSFTCHPNPGERADGRNLIDEMVADGYRYLCDPAAFAALDPLASTHLLGLFTSGGYPEDTQYPPLEDMTRAAIATLSQDPEGFFLMVEGAQIDWASHDNDTPWMLQEMAELDRAVIAALDFTAEHANTLVIVAADHETGGLQLSRQASNADNDFDQLTTPNGDTFYLRWSSTSHTPANIRVNAQGTGAEMLIGTNHLTRVYDAMYYALTGQEQLANQPRD